MLGDGAGETQHGKAAKQQEAKREMDARPRLLGTGTIKFEICGRIGSCCCSHPSMRLAPS